MRIRSMSVSAHIRADSARIERTEILQNAQSRINSSVNIRE